jgi:small subunit ribosomal protein S3
MGQKVHPTGIRLGIIRHADSTWYAGSKDFSSTLLADIKAREYLQKELAHASVSRVRIERPTRTTARVTIHAARPGVIIGKKGEDVERLKNKVSAILGVPSHISIEEIRKPELDARLVAEGIAQQLEKRIMFRRAMKRAVTTALRLGALGIKVAVAGRLGGAEIARTERYHEGRVPLHTFRADIDYGIARANTTYGVIGVKVWIFKGEVFGPQESASAAEGQQDKEKA